MAQGRAAKAARAAPVAVFAQRLARLRTQLKTDPGGAGDQALKLVEEFLELQARAAGYDGDGSMRRYAQWLRSQRALSTEVLQRIEAYTDARNALAHTYGLMTTPAFAAELVGFAGDLLRQQASGVEQVMTQQVRTVHHSEPAAAVRDLMLSEGYGRLPVLDDAKRCIGLLVERDLILPLADGTLVADVLPAHTLDRIAFVAPGASLSALRERLAPEHIFAGIVTAGGTPTGRVLGIVTHRDLLVRA
jgi:CBS domain-containing protein